jgi:hypothetical protein
MEILGDLIKILLPAVVVLYAVYLTVRAFLVKEYEQKLLEVKRSLSGTDHSQQPDLAGK